MARMTLSVYHEKKAALNNTTNDLLWYHPYRGLFPHFLGKLKHVLDQLQACAPLGKCE